MAKRGVISDGLAGTVTYVDREHTESDERIYSDAVVRRCGVRNETIINPPFWLEDGVDPPLTDRPRDSMALYPRERRLVTHVRGSEGRILLAGFAGDELFTGSMLFLADWLSRGCVAATIREMARRAALGRVSFWDLAYQNVVLPLLPPVTRGRLLRRRWSMAPWVTQQVQERYGLADRLNLAVAYAGPVGGKYHHEVVSNVTGISRRLDAGFLGDVLDVRYPYLSRPLVEFALRLPPELCARPRARKWILREAMSGILPDLVRLRVGKGAVTTLLGWSLATQRHLLEPLVRNSILAELGVVEKRTLHKALETASTRPSGHHHLHSAVQSTLIYDAWLQLRSDRWPLRSSSAQRVTGNHP